MAAVAVCASRNLEFGRIAIVVSQSSGHVPCSQTAVFLSMSSLSAFVSSMFVGEDDRLFGQGLLTKKKILRATLDHKLRK